MSVLLIGTSSYSQKEINVGVYPIRDVASNVQLIEMDFGKFNVLDNEQLKKINPDDILKIEVVCTDYPRGINLESLNSNRFKQLNNDMRTRGFNKAIMYNTIRQTDFKGELEAKKLFHGLAITLKSNDNLDEHAVLIQKGTPTSNKYDVPESFLVEPELYSIDPRVHNSVRIGKKGTVLHIPKNAFVDDKGNTVKSEVELVYTEYTNSAEIAFSGIPMMYSKKGVEYAFNSSGMFSITGKSEGKEIHVAKSKEMKFDYALAKQNKDIDFYSLKADSSNWELVSEINELPPVSRKKTSQNMLKLVDDVAFGKGGELQFEIAVDFVVREADGIAIPDNGNRRNATLLAAGANAGHTYPDIVAGLNTKNFGVYNCDQAYRIKNQVNIAAKYVDENGREIRGGKVLSMIDLKFNGAFSYDPRKFVCNAKANNVLLLFTANNEMYLLEKGEFQKMKIGKSGTYSFKMKNVTNEIKSSADLSEYLGLN